MVGDQLVMDPRKKDYYYKQAKKEGYVARSAFKLQEIDKKYGLFKPGRRVLDLGAAPGSWTQLISSKVGPSGVVTAVDLNPLKVSSENIVGIQGDIRSIPFPEWVKAHGAFHCVVSDVAPKTTGQTDADHLESHALCKDVLSIALEVLKPGGHFVCKMYQGELSKRFLDEIKKYFRLAKIQKPSASRSESREIFYVGIDFTKRP